MADKEEYRMLYNCAKKVPSQGIIVEIGTGEIASTAILSAATNTSDRKVFSIDNYSSFIMKRDKITKELNESRLKDLKCNNVVLIEGNSIDVAKDFDRKIDMLFIDGSHDYQDIIDDFNAWSPKLKEGGIVCFHDYGSWPDVTQAIDQIIHQRKVTNNSFIALIK